MTARTAWLDGLRGAALVLMVVDHLAVFGYLPDELRAVTRLALPGFMFVAGWLWRPGLRPRLLEVIVAAAASWGLWFLVAGPMVPVLVVFCLTYPLLGLARRAPVTALAVSVLQLSAWPIPWAGYQPGAVLAFLVLGQLACVHGLGEWQGLGQRLAWLAPAGRWPLTLYLGHLAVLVALHGASTATPPASGNATAATAPAASAAALVPVVHRPRGPSIDPVACGPTGASLELWPYRPAQRHPIGARIPARAPPAPAPPGGEAAQARSAAPLAAGAPCAQTYL
ncbi:hypothetical protein [Arhodomonas sp. SL1]|uniref:hypothetical protein n=1 Tax=Arhodomonas sp. SL1 TaxID=3425691 RepID=UPI003F8809EB